MTTIQLELPHAHGDKGPHKFWRADLGECHNAVFLCWCCTCSGYLCGCPCHHPAKAESMSNAEGESGSAAEGYLETEHDNAYNPNNPGQGSY